MRFHNRKQLRTINSNKGSTLLVVVLMMLILSIFVLSFITLFGNNLLQSKIQEQYMETYYLALSGVDLSVAALLQQGVSGSNDTLLYKSFNKNIALASTPKLTDTIQMETGQVDIEITALDKADGRWVQVQSTGILDSNDASRSLKLQFLLENPEVKVWDTAIP